MTYKTLHRNHRRTGNTMGKGKKTKVQTMTYKTLHRNHRRTGNTMGKGKKTKVQTMTYKTLHRNHRDRQYNGQRKKDKSTNNDL